MKPGSPLARHLHTFFHEYLTTQRNVSPHTALAYRSPVDYERSGQAASPAA